jgi:hypothetical protein
MIKISSYRAEEKRRRKIRRRRRGRLKWKSIQN